ncbi:AAA family ATPase [uncultured Parasphingorhabdus sp.]|uniref:AAA family ATPase n=1 Tax=uncultured Parasphingorhabdus sp. TaxID=2709694 RepID=UPI0030DCC2E6|tara:strand:+ start:32748 stop:35873 length:3126 start_codon:yes stop_codon:yes gene_type:complete
MTPLYLQRIALRQFRSFATLDVEIPAMPGVLIVHGSNGLGKSSLFDALEWTLSDRIDHFRDATGVNKPGTYLCRWRDGDPGPTSATMTFSDDSIIARSLLSASSTKSQLGGNVSDVTSYLRAPTWQQSISELQRYLLLTHFLGQSTLSRLTYRKSTERFDILKEAAQSTAIEAIANSLHGQGNNTVVRAYAREIERLERECKALDDVLEQEATLWSETQMSGAIDDAAAVLEASGIADQLILAQIGGHQLSDTLSHDSEPTPDSLQAEADQIERDCLETEAKISEAKKLHSDLQRVLADIAENEASHLSSQTRIDALSRELEQARNNQEQRRADVSTRRESMIVVNSGLGRLRDLIDARELVAKLTTQHREAIGVLSVVEQTQKEAERTVIQAERTQQIIQRLSGEIESFNAELTRLRSVVTTVDQAIESGERIREQSDMLAEIVAANPNLDQSVIDVSAAVAAVEDRVNVQKGAVEALRDTVDTLSTALASIATHLHPDESDCPVCNTHFASPSDLQARASTAAQRLAPTLVVQEKALRDLIADRDERKAKLQTLKAAQATIRSSREVLDAEKLANNALFARITEISSGATISLSVDRAKLTNEIAAVNTRLRRKQRWHTLLSSEGISSYGVDRANAIRSRDTAQRAVEASKRKVADLSASLSRANADEAAKRSVIDSTEDIGSEVLAAMLREAESATGRSQAELDAAIQVLADTDAIIAALEAEQAGLKARLIENDSRKSELEDTARRIRTEWLDLGRFDTEPDLVSPHRLERRVSEARVLVKKAQGQITRLRQGRLAWARQLSHRAVLEQVREQVDGPPNGGRSELLASADSLREKYRSNVQAIRQVKEIARAASADINAELEDFNSEYIKPLGFLMAEINQAILCDPRVGIDLHVKKKKIEQSAVKQGEVPEAVGEIDPMLVHSEGQMAALAVSMLCAASLTFPWSRWKALVLDDPLQHNDSIHAAAFADLMGNLVSAEGYQILLSTHDVAQAEFLQRKFRSRRIPCTTLSLLGIGKEGVEWSVRSPTSGNPEAATA